jgi:hypothetical protein
MPTWKLPASEADAPCDVAGVQTQCSIQAAGFLKPGGAGFGALCERVLFFVVSPVALLGIRGARP